MKISSALVGTLLLVMSGSDIAVAKLTTQKPHTLQLDAKIMFKGVKADLGQKLSDEFESQLGKFGRCTRHDKNETLRMTAQFHLTKKGRFDSFKVTENLPATPHFVGCFSKKIKDIKLTPPKRPLTGTLTLHVDYVEKSGLGIQKAPEMPPIEPHGSDPAVQPQSGSDGDIHSGSKAEPHGEMPAAPSVAPVHEQ